MIFFHHSLSFSLRLVAYLLRASSERTAVGMDHGVRALRTVHGSALKVRRRSETETEEIIVEIDLTL